MRSPRGLYASIAFLMALPLAALSQLILGTGAVAVIHGLLAIGALLMSLAVFDFKAPKWATWIGSMALGALAVVFFVQAISELVHNETLTHVAYQVLGQRLEAWLVNAFLTWCVIVLVVDRQAPDRILGIVAMGTVASVQAYTLALASQSRSLDSEAPILKVLLLAPFVWILVASIRRNADHHAVGNRGNAEPRDPRFR